MHVYFPEGARYMSFSDDACSGTANSCSLPEMHGLQINRLPAGGMRYILVCGPTSSYPYSFHTASGVTCHLYNTEFDLSKMVF